MIQLPELTARTVTVRDLLHLLLAEYRLRERRTSAHLECRMRLHLLPLLGETPAAALDHRYIQTYMALRKSGGAAPATINRELEHLRAALRLAFEGGLIAKAAKIRLLPVDNVRTGFIDHWDYARLRRAIDPYLEPLFVAGYHTGCRSGELLRIEWSQVDLPAAQIWLRPEQTKNKKARLVPIFGDLGPVLDRQRRDRDARFPRCGLVFHRNGNPIVDYRKAWARGLRKAGISGLRFHDLRRSAVRNMDRAGVPRSTIRRIIGHETEAMFQRYRIVDQQEIEEAGRRVGAYLESQPAERTVYS